MCSGRGPGRLWGQAWPPVPSSFWSCVSGSSPQQRLLSFWVWALGAPGSCHSTVSGCRPLGTASLACPLPSQRLSGAVSSHSETGVLILSVDELVETEGLVGLFYAQHEEAMVRTLIHSCIYILYQPRLGKVLEERTLLRGLCSLCDTGYTVLSLPPPPHPTHTLRRCVTQEEPGQEASALGFGVWRQGGTGEKTGNREPFRTWGTARKLLPSRKSLKYLLPY